MRVMLLIGVLLLGRCVLLKFRGESVRSDLEHACLPVVAVEHVDRSDAVLPAAHEHGAVSSGPVVAPERDVGAEDGACPSEQVLDVLPSHPERQVANEQTHARVLAWSRVCERRLLRV